MNRELLIKILRNKKLDTIEINDELEQKGYAPLNLSEKGSFAIEAEAKKAKREEEHESIMVRRTYDSKMREKYLAEGKTFHGLPRHIKINLSLPSDLIKDLKANCKSISSYVLYLIREDIEKQIAEGGEWKP